MRLVFLGGKWCSIIVSQEGCIRELLVKCNFLLGFPQEETLTVSLMFYLKSQRVTFVCPILHFPCELHRKPTHPRWIFFFSPPLLLLLPPLPYIPPSLYSNLKSSLTTIRLCHPTHTRDATLLLTTAGDHLAAVWTWERQSLYFVVFLIMRFLISLRRVMSPPLGVFSLSVGLYEIVLFPPLLKKSCTKVSSGFTCFCGGLCGWRRDIRLTDIIWLDTALLYIKTNPSIALSSANSTAGSFHTD